MKIVFSTIGEVVEGLDHQFTTYTIEEDPLIVPATNTPGLIYGDVTYFEDTTEGTYNEANILAGVNPHFEAYDPAQATIDATGHITYVANGSATFLVKDDKKGATTYTRTMAGTNPVASGGWTSFNVGALGEHVTTQLEGLIAGKTGGTDAAQKYWDAFTNDVNNPAATFNPNSIVSTLDMSAMSVMRSNGPSNTKDEYPAMLVTDKHAVGAYHVFDGGGQGVGETVVFLRKSDHTFHSTTITGLVQIGVTDWCVMVFDTPVPITPFKALPVNFWETYAPAIDESKGYSIQLFPFLSKVMHNETDGFESWWNIFGAFGEHPMPPYVDDLIEYDEPSDTFLPFHNGIISGDSGSPNFIMINGEPILQGTHNAQRSGDDHAGGAHDISRWITEINAAMDTLSAAPAGTYTLTHPVITGFNTYL